MNSDEFVYAENLKVMTDAFGELVAWVEDNLDGHQESELKDILTRYTNASIAQLEHFRRRALELNVPVSQGDGW